MTLLEEISNAAYVGKTDAEIATAINTKTVTVRKRFYINARTLYSIDPVAAKSILDALKASDAHLYQIMMEVGDNDGSRGCVDVSLDSTRAIIDSMNLGAAGDAIKSLGEMRQPYYINLGFNRPLDFADVAKVRGA